MRKVCWVLALALGAQAQDIVNKIDWQKLASRAVEKVQVNLDADLLKMAAKSLAGKSGDQAQVQRLLENIRSVQVRSLEFEKPGEYSMEEVNEIRRQLSGPGWSKIVEVEGVNENVSVAVRTKDGKIERLAVVSAEPKELTVVDIDGSIDPAQLGELGGRLGIPRLGIPNIGVKSPPAKSKNR